MQSFSKETCIQHDGHDAVLCMGFAPDYIAAHCFHAEVVF